MHNVTPLCRTPYLVLLWSVFCHCWNIPLELVAL